MGTTAYPGPLSITGKNPPMLGPAPYVGGRAALVDENPDFAPNLLWMGIGIRDPRYLAHIGAGANVAGGYPNQDCGWFFAGPGVVAIDQVPSAPVANNIAASQATTVGGALTLAGASTGVTVLTAPLTILPTGNIIPAGALVLDGNPTYVGGGQSGAFAFFNPANAISRALVVAGAASDVTITGNDVYGVPITQRLAAATGTKAFKFIRSISGNAVAAGTTVGTVDVFGLPLYSARWSDVLVDWDSALLTANTGYVAGVTATATATTGDVRGTFDPPTAADAARRLVVYQSLNFGVIAATYAAALAALLGVPQA